MISSELSVLTALHFLTVCAQFSIFTLLLFLRAAPHPAGAATLLYRLRGKANHIDEGTVNCIGLDYGTFSRYSVQTRDVTRQTRYAPPAVRAACAVATGTPCGTATGTGYPCVGCTGCATGIICWPCGAPRPP